MVQRRSGAAIRKVREEKRGFRKRAHGSSVARMIFIPQCKSLKVKQSLSSQIGADARLAKVG